MSAGAEDVAGGGSGAPGGRGGLEPWSWVALALGGLTLGSYLVLGLRPGAPLGPWIHLRGTLFCGLACMAMLAFGIAWSLLHRPVLARRRIVPFLVLAVCVWLASAPIPYPSSHAQKPSSVAFRLPFQGRWRVRWGGERRAENALALLPDRRYGFAFEPLPPAPEDPPSEHPPGTVLAPAAGVVVSAEGEQPDGAPRGERSRLGNTLVLEVAPGEYLVLGDLAAGSLRVAPGERVEAGQELARLGDSAVRTLPEPALLVHLQDDPRPGHGEGIPLRFRDYLVGGRVVAAGVPRGGLRGTERTGEVVRPADTR